MRTPSRRLAPDQFGFARLPLEVLIAALILVSAIAIAEDRRVGSAELRPSRLPRLELVLFDRTRLSQDVRYRLEQETAAILSELGAEAVWLEPVPDRRLWAPGTEIQILLSSSRPQVWGYEATVMGGVLPTHQQPRRQIVVFPARVAEVLRRPGRYRDRSSGSPRLAVGLGRVIAHEIVHAVAPEHSHASKGIMRGRHDSASLLEPETSMDSFCAAALLDGLRTMMSAQKVMGSVTRHQSLAAGPV